VTQLIEDPETPRLWRERRARMLDHAVDVSTWYHDLLVELHDVGVATTLDARRKLRVER
jgi:hypothetical protein